NSLSDHEDVRRVDAQGGGGARNPAIRRKTFDLVVHRAGLAQRVRKERGLERNQAVALGRERFPLLRSISFHINTCAGLMALCLPLLAVISNALGTDSLPAM